jgi:membrane protein implicated in regulation of membrane protease activity
MRVAVFVLAVLVFAAGLVLDTGAVLVLVGGFLWEHAVYAAAAALLIVTVVAGWRRLHRRTGAQPRGRVGQARRAVGPRQPRVGSGRGRNRTGKRARAK